MNSGYKEFGMRELAVHYGITKCLNKYARAVDRRDWDTVRECYTADAYDDHGTYKGDVGGFIEDLEKRHIRIRSSMHFITNTLIDRISVGKAFAESYCLCYRQYYPGSEGTQPAEEFVRCRYLDQYIEEQPGVWKVERRTLVYEDFQSSVVDSFIPDGATKATRDADDPVWKYIELPTRSG